MATIFELETMVRRSFAPRSPLPTPLMLPLSLALMGIVGASMHLLARLSDLAGLLRTRRGPASPHSQRISTIAVEQNMYFY